MPWRVARREADRRFLVTGTDGEAVTYEAHDGLLSRHDGTPWTDADDERLGRHPRSFVFVKPILEAQAPKPAVQPEEPRTVDVSAGNPLPSLSTFMHPKKKGKRG